MTNEIKMKDEGGAAADAGADAGGAGALLRNNLLMNALWSIVGGHRPHVSALWGGAAPCDARLHALALPPFVPLQLAACFCA